MRYEVNRENRDLDLAHTVLQYAVANHENCIPSLLAQSGMGIVRACNYQFAAGQGIKRLEEGIEIFQFVLAREAEELDESMLVPVMVPFGELLTPSSGRRRTRCFGILDRQPGADHRRIPEPAPSALLPIPARGSSQRHLRTKWQSCHTEPVDYLSLQCGCVGWGLVGLNPGSARPSLQDALLRHEKRRAISNTRWSHTGAVWSCRQSDRRIAAELDHYSQALRESFAIDRDPSRLDRAVEMAERALSLLQKDDPRQATVVGNLANHLQTRGRELDRPDDLIGRCVLSTKP